MNFRSCFGVIRKLSVLGTPIMFKSRTIPKPFISRLGNYFINNNIDGAFDEFSNNHNIINSVDLITSLLEQTMAALLNVLVFVAIPTVPIVVNRI